MPPVMLPLPSALKEPTRAKNPPVEPSSPLMEKAYWPFKLVTEKPPVGGGGVGVVPPPPQAAAKSANDSESNSARVFPLGKFALEVNDFTAFIARLPADPQRHFWREPCWREWHPQRAADRARSARQVPARPTAQDAP